ncbi:hypothetical protein Dimus_017330 [Dionaea muscipula]
MVLLLPLPALGGGDPGALDVGGALEPAALAAGPAPHVNAVLLRLVPAVLAAHPSSTAACCRPHHHSAVPSAAGGPGRRVWVMLRSRRRCRRLQGAPAGSYP